MYSVAVGILFVVEFETGFDVIISSGIVYQAVGAGAVVVTCREFAWLLYVCYVVIGLCWNYFLVYRDCADNFCQSGQCY